jgi:hypothetical protein
MSSLAYEGLGSSSKRNLVFVAVAFTSSLCALAGFSIIETGAAIRSTDSMIPIILELPNLILDSDMIGASELNECNKAYGNDILFVTH